MIDLSKCPECGNTLIYVESYNKKHKYCTKNLDHSFRLVFDDNNHLILMTFKELNKKPKLNVCWNFVEKRIFVGPYLSIKGRTIGLNTTAHGYQYKDTISLPWFDPDLDDFTKLINKIKTYVLFS